MRYNLQDQVISFTISVADLPYDFRLPIRKIEIADDIEFATDRTDRRTSIDQLRNKTRDVLFSHKANGSHRDFWGNPEFLVAMDAACLPVHVTALARRRTLAAASAVSAGLCERRSE